MNFIKVKNIQCFNILGRHYQVKFFFKESFSLWLNVLKSRFFLMLFLFTFYSFTFKTEFSFTGNFITDIIHNVTEVDCVILNSGTLRSDTLHPPGKFKMKVTCFYFSIR